jgi:tyrosyl-tRNA synthetase
MLLRKFLKHGHKVIFLLGGATTKIGDPSGKDETRRVLTDEEIEENKKGIMENFAQFVDVSSPNVAILNNIDWLGGFSYIDFLRDVGSHFTVNRMLAMDSVKMRISKQNPMSFVEFNYMLMQGYDFAYLNKHYNCILQVGGSDQWGNITEGMELCGRMNNKEGFALTSPLITRADGEKMGKSLKGAVSLSSRLTSSFEYFQYFRNMPDEDISKMLKIYTDLPLEKIKELEALKGKEVNEAKRVLAFEATKLARGEEEAKKALEEAENIFTQNNAPEGEGLILQAKIGEGLLKILAENGALKSISEGKTLVASKAIKINDIVLENFSFTFTEKSEIKVSIGKKKHYKIICS